MNEYEKEISDLEKQVEDLLQADGDPKEIAELSMQLDILKAIYGRSTELFEHGAGSDELQRGLAIGGYGDWNLDNVYAYVYEHSVEMEDDAHSSFVKHIRSADFEEALLGHGS